MSFAWSNGQRRAILHSDMNCFYANVECLHRPELRDKPVVVGGRVEERHGIVLAKNAIAKAYGVKTGEALWQARQKCPSAVVIPPDYKIYMRFSKMARRIYYDYTDLVEPFGPDEAWLDVTGSLALWGGDPALIAQEISERIKAELGITVSIGLSWNKIFAKFGSDYKKPDAITAITPENYRELVWEAPAQDLLYVGRATAKKLLRDEITTIGDIANTPSERLMRRLGKVGLALWAFSRGEDATPVKRMDPNALNVEYDIKSIGNGLTAPYDITCDADAKALACILVESVAQRLREHRVRARTMAVYVRDAVGLDYTSRQAPLPHPTNITGELICAAWDLLRDGWRFDAAHPVRSMGVRASSLQDMHAPVQLDITGDYDRRERLEGLDATIDDLRRRYGNKAVRRARELVAPQLQGIDIKESNVVHPVGFFAR